MVQNEATSGKVALITAAGRNIGRAIALSFSRSGINVAINVRNNLDEAERVAGEAREHGVQALVVPADVSAPDEVEGMIAKVRAEMGTVDILVNCAAIRPFQPFLDISIADWHNVIGVGLHGAFYCSRLVIPDMVAKGWGRIISLAGEDGFVGQANRAHGVTTKAAVHGLTKALALEFGSHGITANTVSPGVINTTRPAAWYPHLDYSQRVLQIPAGVLGEPEDVAYACMYLVERGRFVNGQVIHVNGGEHLF